MSKKSSKELSITRIAHSSFLLEYNGHFLLTDPWFSEKAGYYHGEPLGLGVADLPKLDAIVISHLHYDHSDLESLAGYKYKTVPLLGISGLAKRAKPSGFLKTTELEPWQTSTAGPYRITAAPAKHGVPENTYVIETGPFVVYFGGDSLLVAELRQVADKFRDIDVALLPVNGLRLRFLFNRKVVMNPADAAEAVAILRPKYAIPIHDKFTAGPLRDRFFLKITGTAEDFIEANAVRNPACEAISLSAGQSLICKD